MGNLPSKSKPKSKHRPDHLRHNLHHRQQGQPPSPPSPRSKRLASISSNESAASAVSFAGSGSDSAASLSSRHRLHLTSAFACLPPAPHAATCEKQPCTRNAAASKLAFVDPSFCLDAAVSLYFKFSRASTSPVPIAYLGAFDDLTDDLPPFPPAPPAALDDSSTQPPQVWFTCHDHSGILSVARTLVDSQGTPILHYHNADVYRGPPPGIHARCLQVTTTTTQRGGKISLVARPTDPNVLSPPGGSGAALMLTLQAKERDDVKYIRASPYVDPAGLGPPSRVEYMMGGGGGAAGHRKRTMSSGTSATVLADGPLGPSSNDPGVSLSKSLVASQAKCHSTSPKLAAKGARRGDPIVARIRRQLRPAPESAVAKAKNIAYVVDVAPGVDVAAIAAVCMYVYAAEAKCRTKRSQSSVGQLVS